MTQPTGSTTFVGLVCRWLHRLWDHILWDVLGTRAWFFTCDCCDLQSDYEVISRDEAITAARGDGWLHRRRETLCPTCRVVSDLEQVAA
jgi:hypothetical protein